MDWLVLAEIASHVEQEEREQLNMEVADLADAERAALTVEDRLRGALNCRVEVWMRGVGLWLYGRVEAVGQGWFLMSDATHEWIAFSHATLGLRGAVIAREAEPGLPVTATSLLRQLQGAFVELLGEIGQMQGTIVGVGKDHLLIEGQIESRYGSYAEQWQDRYFYGESERLSQIAVALDAIAVVRQARVNRL
ncbi:hypothetical protein [Trueperella pyogenes]|uniref:hypothetical protein n=1 Tax=Trueperella pyogenes TaxID=1661 RepID=UPI00058047D6|nr:hypothetical protein [Trueperella pyogenes]AJC70668.1 hypothetical protein X956_08230 [Trueperella pyogenes TP8]WHU60947.1 hypothetical protein QEV13_09990 [Trueperella pyogenes]